MFCIPEGWQHSIFYIHPLMRIFDFILGVGLCFLFIHKKEKVKAFANLIQVGAVILFLLSFMLSKYFDPVFRYSIYYWPSMLLVIFSFALPSGKIRNCLSFRWMNHLGEVSFGIYMWHLLIIQYCVLFFNTYLVDWEKGYAVLFIFMITLLLSLISFQYFETPMRRFIRDRFSG
jgi:peptidoglycan/LPS O-acetylase OafA/YrhL